MEDSQRALTLADVLKLPSNAFSGGQTKALNFGFTDSAYWFRVVVRNESSDEDDWILESLYPILDQIEVYALYQNGMQTQQTSGDSVPFQWRSIEHHTSNFRLHLNKGEQVELFIRCVTTGSVQMPLTLWSERAFAKNAHTEQMVLGAYYGLLVSLAVYNLLIFISVRDINYFNYVLYILGYGTFQFTLNGLSYEYLWPNSPWWNNCSVAFTISTGMITILIFSSSFLSLKVNNSKALWVFRALMVFFALTALASLLVPYQYAIRLATAGAAITVACVFVVGMMCLIRKYKPARYFMLAWALLLMGMLMYTLKTFAILPANFFTEFGIQIGSSMELLLLSFALADRIRLLTAENELHRQHELAAQQKAKEAELESRAKTQFLATMSHEIRTPMNGVLGMSELLQATELQPLQRQYLSVISQSGKALLTVINDILDFSKIEAGKLDIEKIDVDLEQLTDECIAMFALQAEEKGLELFADIEPDVERYIKADPVRLRQVLLNLLGNAIKFTECGRIRLSVSALNDRMGQGTLRFSVSDTGIGISSEQKIRLFQPFSQADHSTTRKFGGTGLGLVISKRICELMGGEMGVVSAIGKGSTFWFNLPCEKADDAFAEIQRDKVRCVSQK
ncbi:MAG TPA: 7TM diverse intracellular signaling domain-containing protein, partial [Pseudomonadales bacterium]|nr:7TM diverse intracellular signaling domain-containing protein [Pseudomonadales bacterium]